MLILRYLEVDRFDCNLDREEGPPFLKASSSGLLFVLSCSDFARKWEQQGLSAKSCEIQLYKPGNSCCVALTDSDSCSGLSYAHDHLNLALFLDHRFLSKMVCRWISILHSFSTSG